MEDKKIKLTDIPYGDGYIVVYTLEHESKKKSLLYRKPKNGQEQQVLRGFIQGHYV